MIEGERREKKHVRIRILGRGEMQLNGRSVEGRGQELIEHHRCIKRGERADVQRKHPRGGGGQQACWGSAVSYTLWGGTDTR